MHNYSKTNYARRLKTNPRFLILGVQRHCAIQCINGMCDLVKPYTEQVVVNPFANQSLKSLRDHTHTPYTPLATSFKKRKGRGFTHKNYHHTRRHSYKQKKRRHHTKPSYPIWQCYTKRNKIECKRKQK